MEDISTIDALVTECTSNAIHCFNLSQAFYIDY